MCPLHCQNEHFEDAAELGKHILIFHLRYNDAAMGSIYCASTIKKQVGLLGKKEKVSILNLSTINMVVNKRFAKNSAD